MAEGGDISELIEMVGGEDRDTKANPAGGLLAPGGIVSDVYFNTNRTRNRYLSLTAMLLPTNDGFVGLDSLRIPRFRALTDTTWSVTMPAPRPMMNVSPAVGLQVLREFQLTPVAMPAMAASV